MAIPLVPEASGLVNGVEADTRPAGQSSAELRHLILSKCSISMLGDCLVKHLLSHMPSTLRATSWSEPEMRRHFTVFLEDAVVLPHSAGPSLPITLQAPSASQKTLLTALHSRSAWLALEAAVDEACREFRLSGAVAVQLKAALGAQVGLGRGGNSSSPRRMSAMPSDSPVELPDSPTSPWWRQLGRDQWDPPPTRAASEAPPSQTGSWHFLSSATRGASLSGKDGTYAGHSFVDMLLEAEVDDTSIGQPAEPSWRRRLHEVSTRR
eukprot:TRINITY_DN3840_c1_g1_i9.p1 TRINITY_DN3840_c1_g1~~TRINITY_DN3840_c1_g1_i9.p1  ORF type:complete len:266 (+),score=35.42 TRINITY_DN3840_c1_g1_i9:476-1273(+)